MCKQGYSVVSFGNMHIIKYVICGIVILGYARDSGTTEVCIRGWGKFIYSNSSIVVGIVIIIT